MAHCKAYSRDWSEEGLDAIVSGSANEIPNWARSLVVDELELVGLSFWTHACLRRILQTQICLV